MSHYVVMVIGNDPEKQLEPYDENIQVEEYVNGKVSKKDKDDFKGYYCKDSQKISDEEKKENKKLSFEDLYAKYGYEWNRNTWRKVGRTWKEFSTYNPDSKWDWYQLGGRWVNYFKLKRGESGVSGDASFFHKEGVKGGYADQCKKGAIDIEYMEKDVIKKAEEDFDNIMSVINGREVPRWEPIFQKYGKENVESAREEYYSIPVIKDLSDNHLLPFFGEVVDIFCNFDREKYIERKRKGVIIPYAFVKDGEWYERGKMGWFGMAYNEKDADTWENEFYKMFSELPDDTLISVFDCHI